MVASMVDRWGRSRVAAVAVLLTAAVTWLWAHEGHAPLPTKGARVDAEKGRVALSAVARSALDVRTAEVETRPVAEDVLATAELVAPWHGRAQVTARLAGRVTAVHVRPGQPVEVGQPLAEVESLELENLRLELTTARTEADAATRVLRLLEGRSVSEQSLLEARTKARQAETALEVARTKWLSLGLDAGLLDDLLAGRTPDRPVTLPARSPIRGTVTLAPVGFGKVVEPAEPLFEVVDPAGVWVRIGVLERDALRVMAGQAVDLSFTAYPGEPVAATVTAVGQDLDPRTHLVTAWAELPNPPGAEPRWLPGLRGLARLRQPGAPAARAVPEAAVFGEGGRSFVLVEESHTATGSEYQRKDVAPGRRAGGFVEVVAGEVVPGERVVTQGGHELAGYFAPQALRPSPEMARTIGLRVEPVGTEVVEEVVGLEGDVELSPDRRAVAAAPVAGTLVRLYIGPGQSVRAGDVIAEVAALDLLNLQLDLLRADREGRLFEESLERLRRPGGTTSPRQVAELEAQVAVNHQQRDTVGRKLRALGLTDEQRAGVTAGRLVETLPVRAPIDGVVVGFDRTLGQAVPAHEPIVEVHDPSRPLVKGYVVERDLGRVRPGQAVRVRVTADPAFVGTGTLVRSGRVLGGDSRTLAVWAELASVEEGGTVGLTPRRSPPLRHGQLARLSVTVTSPSPTLAVPAAAVVRDGLQAFVFVRRPDGRFDRQPVTTGRGDDRFVEVVAGLTAGEPVAVSGADALQTAYAVVR